MTMSDEELKMLELRHHLSVSKLVGMLYKLFLDIATPVLPHCMIKFFFNIDRYLEGNLK